MIMTMKIRIDDSDNQDNDDHDNQKNYDHHDQDFVNFLTMSDDVMILIGREVRALVQPASPQKTQVDDQWLNYSSL